MKGFLCLAAFLAVTLAASLPFLTGIGTANALGHERSHRGAKAGGWMIHDEIDTDAMGIFEKAVAELKTKTKYQPFSCATQVVNGLNYAFLCAAVDEEGDSYFCVISCYRAAGADTPIAAVNERVIPFREQ